MAHITSLGAAIFTDLAIGWDSTVTNNAVDLATVLPSTPSAVASWEPFFATEGVTTDCFARILHVREFPSIGTPANIVNVPEYGVKQSLTVQGQADAPSLEVQINYIPNLWLKGTSGTVLGNAVGDGKTYAFRFALLQTDPGLTNYESTAGGLGLVPNSQYFWIGKIEALLVKSDLRDTVTATLTLSIQSDFYGAFTH